MIISALLNGEPGYHHGSIIHLILKKLSLLADRPRTSILPINGRNVGMGSTNNPHFLPADTSLNLIVLYKFNHGEDLQVSHPRSIRR